MVNTSDGEKRVDEQKDLQHKDATGGLKRGRGMASLLDFYRSLKNIKDVHQTYLEISFGNHLSLTNGGGNGMLPEFFRESLNKNR
jgi:hypothetical protein